MKIGHVGHLFFSQKVRQSILTPGGVGSGWGERGSDGLGGYCWRESRSKLWLWMKISGKNDHRDPKFPRLASLETRSFGEHIKYPCHVSIFFGFVSFPKWSPNPPSSLLHQTFCINPSGDPTLQEGEMGELVTYYWGHHMKIIMSFHCKFHWSTIVSQVTPKILMGKYPCIILAGDHQRAHMPKTCSVWLSAQQTHVNDYQ